MPYKEPDPSDPSVLVGMSMPADPESDLDMAYVFAEEFARLGYDEAHLVQIFQAPHYAGAHRLWCVLGEATIRDVVRAAVGAWGHFRCTTREPAATVQWRSSVPRVPEGQHEQGL